MVNRGFTLVELLVVIGIIALLISILIPTLGKAREAGARTSCLSNMRQLHQSLVMYANANRDYLPVGYRAGTPDGIKQFNSMVYSGTSQKRVLWGLLVDTPYLKNPAILFCPAEADPSRQQGTDSNPWPPPALPATSTRNIQGGYAGRPLKAIPDDPAAWGPTTLPKFKDFHRKAMLSDLTTLPARVDSRHRTGINMLAGDGSGQWVPRKTFNDPLSQCTGTSTTFNPQQDQIWQRLDP